MFFPKANVQTALGLGGYFGSLLTDVLMSITGINKTNVTFKPLEGLKGIEFAQASLDVLGVNAVVSPEDVANIPQTGPCIICSNHPFGCLDGLMMLATVGKVRKDVRIMTNFILTSIPCLSDSFIAVDPFSAGKPKSINGVKTSLEHLQGGGCLVLFPAGEVSSDRNDKHIVKDIEWHNGAIRLIRKAGVPVIPAYFSGQNSRLFHSIGTIHPMLRTLRLPWEMMNKSGQTVFLKFGKPVHPVELASYPTQVSLTSYLRNRTYFLEGLLYGEQHPVILQNQSDIEAHVAPSLLIAEVKSLEKNILYRQSGYTCYLCRYDEIPNMIHEIGVCREETFRKNGEGTGKSIDLDIYDEYYLHMFLWNDDQNEFVGAYRIGLGGDIMSKYGIKGFYSDLFFHFKDEISPLLKETIELGRSFIVEKYQTVPNILRYLLNKGIGSVLSKYSGMKYFMGPASISSNYPPMFSSLIVEYLSRTCINEKYKGMIEPDCPFVSELHKIDVDAISLEKLSIDRFDKTLYRLSSGKFRLPPLIRAYSKANCTFIGFNVDPCFNFCVDALVLTAFEDIPEELRS